MTTTCHTKNDNNLSHKARTQHSMTMTAYQRYIVNKCKTYIALKFFLPHHQYLLRKWKVVHTRFVVHLCLCPKLASLNAQVFCPGLSLCHIQAIFIVVQLTPSCFIIAVCTAHRKTERMNHTIDKQFSCIAVRKLPLFTLHAHVPQEVSQYLQRREHLHMFCHWSGSCGPGLYLAQSQHYFKSSLMLMTQAPAWRVLLLRHFVHA